jgi:uncharacterized protein DUF7024
MRMKFLFLSFLAALLCVFYLTIVYLALHPHVSREYKAYYIDRITSDWKPARYAATADQGIRLGVAGLPSFVDYIYGFSWLEPWGRWTDAQHGAAAGVVLQNPISGVVCVMMKVMPASSQRGKVITIRLGDEQHSFVPKPDGFSDYSFDFSESRPADSLQIRFDGAVPSQSEFDRGSSDHRKLGLAVMYIRFFSQTCSTVKENLTDNSSEQPNQNQSSSPHRRIPRAVKLATRR